MSTRTAIMILLALAFGLSAAYGINVLVHERGAAQAPPVETAPVVVATKEIRLDHVVNADSVVVKQFPRELVPAGAVGQVEDVVNRIAAFSMSPGDPVLESKLVPPGGGRGLSARIGKGKRAVTIPATSVGAGVAGLILPGNKVDVLVTITTNLPKEDTTGGRTTPVLQNVEVLAVDQRLDPAGDNKSDPNLRSVTLLVTPTEAARLSLAQNKGTLQLALRHPEDGDLQSGEASGEDIGLATPPPPVVAAPVTTNIVPAVAPAPPAAPPPAAPPKPLEIVRLRGAQRDVIRLDPVEP